MKPFVFFTSYIFVAASFAQAMDWTQFQGTNLDRISTESGWNMDWGTEGPEEQWRTRIGHGYSALTIADGMVFTMGYDARAGEDIVYAKSMDTGELLWDFRYECLPMSNLHKGGPSATPLYHDGKLYTLSKEAHFFCFEAQTGEVLWSHDLKDVLGVETPFCGFTNSPIMVNGNVIVDAGALVAVDPDSGDVVWKTAAHEPQYAAPEVFVQNGTTVIASLVGSGLVFVDADSGAELGSHGIRLGQRNAFCNTPVYSSGTLLVSGQGTLGLIKLDVSDLSEISEIWTRRDIETLFNQPVMLDGRLYVHERGANKPLHCLDYASGETLWTSDLLSDGPFMIVNGKLLALSGQGEVILAEITTDGFEPLGRKQVFGGNCWTPPVLSNGMIFCRNENGDVVALDVRS